MSEMRSQVLCAKIASYQVIASKVVICTADYCTSIPMINKFSLHLELRCSIGTCMQLGLADGAEILMK